MLAGSEHQGNEADSITSRISDIGDEFSGSGRAVECAVLGLEPFKEFDYRYR